MHALYNNFIFRNRNSKLFFRLRLCLHRQIIGTIYFIISVGTFLTNWVNIWLWILAHFFFVFFSIFRLINLIHLRFLTIFLLDVWLLLFVSHAKKVWVIVSGECVDFLVWMSFRKLLCDASIWRIKINEVSIDICECKTYLYVAKHRKFSRLFKQTALPFIESYIS